MAEASGVNDALGRVDAAIHSLESAIEGRREELQATSGLEEELHRLGLDRSQLAQSLDTAESRSGRLEETNREVSRRLVAAMESLRQVLARYGR